MKNYAYEKIREHIKKNGGFDTKMFQTDTYKLHERFISDLKKLEGKKVKIKTILKSAYFGSCVKEYFGTVRICPKEDEHAILFERGFRKRYYILDSGMFEGWEGVIIPLEIEIINKFPKRKKKSFAEQYGLEVRN